ncbi:MAG: BON domain-containing protein [Planctomycetota bacterium]
MPRLPVLMFVLVSSACVSVASAQQRNTGGGAATGGGSLFGGGSSFGGTSSFGGGGSTAFGQASGGQAAFGQSSFGQTQAGGQNTSGFVGRSGADSQAFFEQLGRGSNQFFQRLERSFSRRGDRGRGAAQPQEQRPPVRVQLRLGFTPELDATARTVSASTSINKSLMVKRFDWASVAIADGVATLTGAAPSASDRRLIERLARLEPGVVRVDNQITAPEDLPRPQGDAQPTLPGSGT